MRFRSLGFVLSTLVLLTSFSVGQATPSEAALEKAKKKKELDERIGPLLDQTIVEANGLRLSNNRAVILAMSGDLYWRFDSKRSRELFRSAAAEVVNYNQDVEKEKRESTEIGIVEQFDQNDPRAEILNLISSRDADLPLELMVTTRSASLSDAMARVSVADLNAPGAPSSGPPPIQGDPNVSMDRVRVSQEIAMEERFKMQAAYSDPERAIKAVKDSLAKGISTNVISLLQVVYRADEKKAVDLSGEVVSKVLGADLAKNTNDLNGVVSFMQYFARPVQAPPANSKTKPPFSFSDTQAREVANKLANTFLQPRDDPAAHFCVDAFAAVF